jgi:hypothetical protein
MPQKESILRVYNSGRFDQIQGLNPAVRMDLSQAQCLEAVLSRAFHNDPSVTYILPDEATRRAALPWFFRSVAIRASQFIGEIYTTADADAAALWICPGRMSAFPQIAWAEMNAMPFRLEPSTVRRWTSLRAQIERVHQQLVEGPHWYLMALGVEQSRAVKSVSGVLIEPVVSRADCDRLPCYVETFDEKLLPFYEEWGFQIAGAGQIQKDGPNYWALLRKCQ